MATPEKKLNVFSGARALLTYNSEAVGYCAGVSGSESISYEPVEVLNLLEVKEFIPTGYHVTLSAQMFRLIDGSLKQQGIFPKYDNILTTGEVSAVVADRTGVVIGAFNGVKCAAHSFDITARGLVSENVEFNVIKLLDSSEL